MNKVKKISLNILTIVNILIILFTTVEPVLAVGINEMPQYFEVTYKGKITYGASSCGDFDVNGKQAFCLEHSKSSPPTGTGLTTHIYYNENVRKALYYGWGGPEQWSGFTSEAHGIVATSLALSHYYAGDKIKAAAESFIEFLATKSVPSYQVSFSKTNVTAYKEGNIQRTETIELVSEKTSGSVTITIPDSVTYVDETHNTRKTGGDVIIYGQTRFHLEAPLNVNLGTWTTGEKSRGFEYQSIVGVTTSSSMQNIGYLDVVSDPANTTSLSVEWMSNGSLKLIKVDNEGKKVSGVSVKLSYNADMSSPIGTYTTGTDGTFTVENLKAGTIYYQEVATPSHLVLDKTIKSANIESGSTTEVTLTNNKKQGYIEITKKDAKTGKVVKKAGTEFEILSNNKVISTIKTNSNGIAKSNLLEYGTYIVREKTNPQNYITTTVTKNVNVDENNKIYQIEISNQPVVGEISLKKTDKETGDKTQGDATLKGATYTLKANENILDPADGTILFKKDETISKKTVGTGTWGDIGEKTIDNNNIIRWTNLPMGNFRVEETKAPTGYLLDNDHVISITQTSSNKSIEIRQVNSQDQVKKGFIQLVKKDKESGKIVKKAGTEFEILYKGKVISTITTNENGIAKSQLLPYGTYTVREKKAPYNYVITTEIKSVDVHENNKVYEIEISNERVTGKINLEKTDTVTGNKPQGEATLEGAIYGLYARTPILDPADGSIIYNTNQKIAELETNSEGKATLDKLYLGQFYVQEIKPSEGYTLDETKYEFDLNYENQNAKVITKELPVKERVISQAFEMIKVSSDTNGEAELLAGVEFTIKSQKDIEKYGSWEEAPIAKNAEGKEAAILVTDEKGYAKSERLPYGTYIVRETRVPDDKYKVPDFTVEITEDSDIAQTWRIFNDTSFKSILAIVKQDAETQKTVQIAGAKFKIKNIETGEYFGYWDWNPLPHYVDTWETNEEGVVMTGEHLLPGKYQLEELESPHRIFNIKYTSEV